MGIARYGKLIFNQMHKLQDKPSAVWIRTRRSGSPVIGSIEEIVYEKTIRVLYTEVETPITSDTSVVLQARTLFYVLKEDFPDTTRPAQNDKIIYKDKTYIVQGISEIADQIYKLTVTLV